MGDCFKRWNFTPQVPVNRACQKDPKAVRKRIHEDYPKKNSQLENLTLSSSLQMNPVIRRLLPTE
jgi:hypothetical protein